MSIIKRLTATVNAQVEQLVGQIENHDAVIGAAINDARGAAARAKARLSRLTAERDRMNTQLTKLQDDEQRWMARAAEWANADQDKALECVRRRRQCEQERKTILDAKARHEHVIAQLTTDLRVTDQRIADLSQQRNLLRTRQATAEAMRSVAQLAPTLDNQIGDTLERWEARVMASELSAEDQPLGDALERDFVNQEERASLLEELAHLTTKRPE